MTAETRGTLYKGPRTNVSRDQGPFRIHFNFPGRIIPDHDDHGYGPLATVVESFMDPDTIIPMHQHRNEEIVSWVPGGLMRHDDREGNQLITDPEHLLVMNSGSGFWHEERTQQDDPPLRMLQIFVRPHSLDLEPRIQHGPIPHVPANEWRLLFGPEDENTLFSVRNDVELYDILLDEGVSVGLPSRRRWDTYFYVFEGAVKSRETDFDRTESGLLVNGGSELVTAREESRLVAFLINSDAPITREGTIGR